MPEPSEDLKSLVKYVVKEGGVTEKAIERNFTHDYDPKRMEEIRHHNNFEMAMDNVGF